MSETEGKITVTYDFEHDHATIDVPLNTSLSIGLEDFQDLLSIIIGLSSGAIKVPQYREVLEKALKGCGVVED